MQHIEEISEIESRLLSRGLIGAKNEKTPEED